MNCLIDNRLARFLFVGVLNTLAGAAIMFGLYNLVHCSYWVSSILNYGLTSILSFFLNKYFTFQNHGKSVPQAARFAIQIAICYLLAYGAAKPLVYHLLQAASEQIRDNAAMLVGMCLFTVLNFLGQRFFTFRK